MSTDTVAEIAETGTMYDPLLELPCTTQSVISGNAAFQWTNLRLRPFVQLSD